MAWPGQMKAEDILGMTPEEFKTKLNSAPSKADLDATNTSVGEVKTQLAQVLEALKGIRTTPEPKIEEPVVTDPMVDILTDPDGTINKKLKPLQDAQAETQAQVMEMRARQNPQFAGVFSQYGDELVQLAAKAPAAQRANPSFWEWHIRAVLGDKYVKGELKTTSYPTLIGTSTSGVDVSGGDSKDPNKGFKPEVANFLKDRNVPLDAAAKLQRLMDDGEPITLANYKGSANA